MCNNAARVQRHDGTETTEPHIFCPLLSVAFMMEKTDGILGKQKHHRYSMYGIFTYIYHQFKPNVDIIYINIPYMEQMGDEMTD